MIYLYKNSELYNLILPIGREMKMSTTANLNMELIQRGKKNWETEMNDNLDKIDNDSLIKKNEIIVERNRIDGHLNSTSAHLGSSITFDKTGTSLTATKIENAIKELNTNLNNKVIQASTGNTEIVNARNSAIKGTTFLNLKSRLEDIEGKKLFEVPTGRYGLRIVDGSLEVEVSSGVWKSVNTSEGLLLSSTPAFTKDIALIDADPNYITNYVQTGETYKVGYYGKVTGLITGRDLCSKVGITTGTLFTANDITWLKFYRKGKILLIASKPVRIDLSWDDIQAKDCVKGKVIEINGRGYLCRLMTGADSSPSTSTADGANTDLSLSKGNNEWDDLFVLFYNQGIFNDFDLWTNYNKVGPNSGTSTRCQEVHSHSLPNRVGRGIFSVSHFSAGPSSHAGSGYGWRPVLEVL